MDRHEESTAFIVSQLSKHRNRNEIIMALCERMKINWREAEQLVREVEAQESRSIAARQSPILLLFGIGVVVIGIVLIYSNASFVINFLLTPHDTISPETALALRSVYYRAGAFLGGVCMLVGGLVGSWSAIARLLNSPYAVLGKVRA